MIRPRSVTRRFVILCMLLVCLMALTLGFSANASKPDRAYLPCCSACEVENPPLACRHGCSPSCAKQH